jgi:hypothetical protein
MANPDDVQQIALDRTYLYPLDLLELLVDTIPRLIKSKAGLIDFFAEAGTPPDVLDVWRDKLVSDRRGINKFQITRSVLRALNQRLEEARPVRLEILRRIANSTDFSTCWDDDRDRAERLVRWVREIAGEKDARTWGPALEKSLRSAEARVNYHQRMTGVEERRRTLEGLKRDLYRVVSLADKARGPALAAALPRLFAHYGMPAAGPLIIAPDGGFGAFEVEGRSYVVELRWQTEPIGRREIGKHLVRVHNRTDGAGGVYISASGYTEAAVAECASALSSRPVVLCQAEELFLLLEFERDLVPFLRAKFRAAEVDRNPLLLHLGGR